MTGSQAVGSAIGQVIRQAVPPWLAPAVVAITHLGNVVFLLSLFTLDYWFGDHERGAHALGLILAGMALITGLKALFAEPRPPEGIRLVGTDGFSFPSGHATISTIGYGALAFDVEAGTRRSRYAVAGVLVVLIALSRVVLGVHFVRDVVAGVSYLSLFSGLSPPVVFLLDAGLLAGVVIAPSLVLRLR